MGQAVKQGEQGWSFQKTVGRGVKGGGAKGEGWEEEGQGEGRGERRRGGDEGEEGEGRSLQAFILVGQGRGGGPIPG